MLYLPWSYGGLTRISVATILISIATWRDANFLLILSLIGCWCNFLVVVANKGRMPVDRYILPTARHCALHEGSRLKFLADRFRAYNRIFSIGDIFLIISLLLIIPYIWTHRSNG